MTQNRPLIDINADSRLTEDCKRFNNDQGDSTTNPWLQKRLNLHGPNEIDFA